MAVIATTYIDTIVYTSQAAGKESPACNHGCLISKAFVVLKVQCSLAVIIFKVSPAQYETARVGVQVDRTGEIQEFM